MSDEIKVQTLPHLFSYYRVESAAPAKSRVSDLVKHALHDKLLQSHASVWISDKDFELDPLYVKPENFDTTIVKGDTVVTIKVCPQGGGGGGSGKDVLRIVATVALIAVGAQFGGAVGGFMGFKATTAQTVGMATIMTVGQFAVNSLIPPPRANFDRGGSDVRESPTLKITGSQNNANPYGVVPRVFGRYKVYPTLAAQPYTEISGNEQYLRLLFDFGYGELQLSDLKIGNTDLSDFEDVETEIQYGTGAENDFKLYSTDISPDPQNILVSASGGAQTITTATNSNEAVIDGYFVGMFDFDAQDNYYRDATVQIKYEYKQVDAGSWTTYATRTYTNNTKQQWYVSERISFASADQYDIRLTRLTADSAVDTKVDQFYISNLKSVKQTSPINVSGHCMVAMRIKATDQLNGVVDQFNAIAQAKLEKWNGSAWTSAVATRNPAWAFAEVLRGAANANPVADSLIDGDGLKDWADACDALAQDGQAKWQFDAVIDYGTTVFELLRDIAAAGRASFAMVDGKYTVVRDIEQSTPVQHFTPRNSFGFSSVKVFKEEIHGIKCRYIDPSRDYQQQEVIAYDDGYSAANASKFEAMQVWGCTSENQAWREGRYLLASARLRPEVYSLTCDIENLICTRGDLVKVLHDVTSIGQKGARIKSVTTDGGGDATHITIDEEVTMLSGLTYNVRIRASDGTSSLHSVVNPVDTVTQLEFTTAIPAASIPVAGDLIQFGQTSLESVDLIVKSIEPGSDLSARLTLVDAAPAILSADTGSIPAFDPKITNTPPRFRALPDTPHILQVYSDENALIINSDGSTTPQIIIDIEPQDLGASVQREFIEYRYKASNEQKYRMFKLPGDTTRIFIFPVLENGVYDLGVRAVSHPGEVSAWKTYLNYEVVGRSTAPAAVQNFAINIVDTTAYLTWDANTESDLDYYQIKFTTKTSGQTFENGIDLFPRIPKTITGVTSPAMTGTYFIKAVDTLGKKSVTATEITTIFESVKDINVIETQTESPTYPGSKTNCIVSDGYLKLDNSTLWDDMIGNMDDWLGLLDAGQGSVYSSGTYEFENPVDLGSVYTSRVTSNIDQFAIDYANSFDSLQGLLDQLEGNWDDLNTTTAPDVNVKLQVALTDDDPSGTPTWSAWQDFFVGEYRARGLKFRAQLISNNVYQTPRIETLSVTVDMPDRVDGASDLSSGAGAYAITYSPAFKSVKAIGIALQDGQQGDYYEITSKSTTGFTITFKNSLGTAVDRTFDWSTIGYGHLAS